MKIETQEPEVVLIESLTMYSEIGEENDNCWSCGKATASHVVIVMRGGLVAYRWLACWPCACERQNRAAEADAA